MPKVQLHTTASPAPLTPEQVCDLPMDELLARVNGVLDTTEINEPKFIGYVTVTASGRVTIHTPTKAHPDTRDGAIRFLITTHLELPTHLFPDVFQVTRFSIADEGARA
ncbi:hypothetical protein ACIRPU_12410 [Streptomyces sp. NPDC102259]|uniref:hypothetical protein n=1 Tax=Streptomyces sp. NPDC102259 TaxID=3366148 RepID=UPI00382A8075